jgi:tRNA pseudouridine38-40 synthase
MKKRFKLILSYDGSLYSGWQKQAKSDASVTQSSLITIQEVVENALQKFSTQTITVHASGRTDAGVHAYGQVIHFDLTVNRTPQQIQFGLNSLLPPSIKVLNVEEVSLDFHAQLSAKKKQYSYYLLQGPCALPSLAPFHYWFPQTLNLPKMQKGLDYLVGEHDFLAFQAADATSSTTVRKIFTANIAMIDNPYLPADTHADFRSIRITVQGSGFLKQMVRSIVGTALQIGQEKRPPEDILMLLETQNRLLIGPTAPPMGLWLDRVWYTE